MRGRSPALRLVRAGCAIVLLSLPAASAHAAWPIASTSPLFVNASGGYQTQPVVVADGTSGLFVAWTDTRDEQKVRVQRFTTSGDVAPGWPLDGFRPGPASAAQRSPALLPDGAGGVFVAWEQTGPAGDWDVWVQHVVAGPAIADGWLANGSAVCTSARNQTAPRLHPDGAGGALVLWADERTRPFTFLYGSRVTPLGSRAEGWPRNGRSIGLLGGPTSPFTSIPDDAGGAFTFYLGADSLMHLHRIANSGEFAAGWPINDGVTLGQMVGLVSAPALVPDGAGGVFAAWSQYTVDMDVKLTRIRGDGVPAPGWVVEGYYVCSAPLDQWLRGAASDGAGGVILAWDDNRLSATKKTDIYALRVLGSGAVAPGWVPEGTGLDVSTSDDRDVSIVPDGLGGAIVVYRSGNFNTGSITLVAQRAAADGTRPTGWATSGNDVGVVAGRDAVPSVVSDGLGGAVIVWSFENTAVPLARLTRIDRNGKLQGPAPGATTDAPESPSELRLAPIAPNPVRGYAQLRFALPSAARVTLEVLDPAGRRVRTLARGAFEAGTHAAEWRGDDEDGRRVASGIYFAVLTAGDERRVRRMLLTR